MTYTVAVLLEDRAFGGHEEGGWYYDYGIPVSLSIAPQRRFKTRAKAQGYLNKLQPLIARINEGRYPVSSVLSDGIYRAYIFGGKPRSYPDYIPHYC
jgi:hypothetical protein